MDKIENAERFASLHVKGSPLVLYNARDAASANAIWEGGAPAIATSSWAVAAAHGYPDGEQIPLKLVEQIIARIAATVDAPLSVDLDNTSPMCRTNAPGTTSAARGRSSSAATSMSQYELPMTGIPERL